MNGVGHDALVDEALGSPVDGRQPFVPHVFAGVLPTGSRRLSWQAQSYARELRTVRNHGAHDEQLNAAEADPAIDSVEFHVRAINEQANRAAEPKPSVAPGPTVNQPEEAEDSTPKSRRGAV